MCCLSAILLVQGTGKLFWDYAKELQGWTPDSREKSSVSTDGFEGLSAYDCQLLSPALNVKASDYHVLTVTLRGDREGCGETFTACNGKPLSDDCKHIHFLKHKLTPEFRPVQYRLSDAKY